MAALRMAVVAHSRRRVVAAHKIGEVTLIYALGLVGVS